jgi:uncharacterized protein YndB with AHSA1/START domain
VPSSRIADTIEREVVLAHPIERVWEVLTEPAHLAQWFGDSATIDLRPGGAALFTWGDDRSAAIVDVVEPPRRFAFWWTSGTGDRVTVDNRTYVEFTLTPTGDGRHTRLQLIESGFTALAHGDKQRVENTRGWTIELADLQAYLVGTTCT